MDFSRLNRSGFGIQFTAQSNALDIKASASVFHPPPGLLRRIVWLGLLLTCLFLDGLVSSDLVLDRPAIGGGAHFLSAQEATEAQEAAITQEPASDKEPAIAQKAAGGSITQSATESANQVAQPSSSEKLDGNEGRQLLLENFRPVPQVKVPQHLLTKASFPVVDVHAHPGYRLKHSSEALREYVELMDRNKIALCVSLDGKLGEDWDEHADYLWQPHRERFVIFVSIDFQGKGKADDPASWDCQRPEFARTVQEQLRAAKQNGASGVKFFKQFGLGWKNPDGSLIRIDDPRWQPIWETCGELKLPILMHVADPVAFFQPIDNTNERWEELHRHPDWSFYGEEFPSHEELLQAFLRIVKKNPKTSFIGAHLASNAEDLATLGKWLDDHPNLHVEFASRIAELGRQPYTARKFLIRYADRVLFGTDGPWPEQRVHYYWRFLETQDENFPYSEKEFPPQGMWNIYGVGLPEDVLRKIYYENASRLIPGVREKIAPHLPQ